MAGWIPPRLRPLLGTDLDAVTADTLVTVLGLQEDTDLDFKQVPYSTGEGEVKECAYDVAAFANAAGGLLIVGVEENGRGEAVKIAAISDPGRDFGLWIHQVVAARIAPSPIVTHRVLRSDGGDFHLVSTQPSIVGPHAVHVGDEALRYPVRVGNTRRYMREAELANRYRRRFVVLAERDQELDDLLEVGVQLVPMREASDSDRWSWLVLALQPDLPGQLSLRRGLPEQWKTWLQPAFLDFPAFGPRQCDHVATGFRSLAFHDGLNPADDAYSLGGRLTVTGSGVVIFGYRGGQGSRGVPDGVSAVFDEYLVGDVVNGLRALAEHAVRTGAVGAATVAARLVSAHQMVLAEYRSGFPGVLSGTRSLEAGAAVVTRQTVDLEAAMYGDERLAVARALLVDIGSAFGLPEPQQITADAQLVRRQFNREWIGPVEAWAQRNGVEVIEDFVL